MKYFQSIFVALSVVASALAQSIGIATPAPGDFITLTSPFTVEIDQPRTISPSQSVSVVISLQVCGETRCPSTDNDQILGRVLFAGDYTPQSHENFKPPYQNFTFNPLDINLGNATLHVAHFFVVGAGPSPALETKNVSVVIRGPRKA